MKRQGGILKQLSPQRILLPVIIGIVVIVLIFYSGFDPSAFQYIRWDSRFALWIAFALLMMVFRHGAYMFRLWLLTNRRLNWRQCFQVIALWEFASAITPSTVGGSAVALYLLTKEKLSFGKSTTIVITVTLIDNLFFVLLAPVFFLLLGKENMLPDQQVCLSKLDLPVVSALHGIGNLFLLGYALFFIISALFIYGVFLNPAGFSLLLKRIFNLKWLQRWRKYAERMAEDVVITAYELKKHRWGFWLLAGLATFVSWTARYLVLNFTMLAFSTDMVDISGLKDQLIIFGRQFVMWVLMLIPTTPGSTGIAELSFIAVQCEFFHKGLEGAIVSVWRLISYYIYLFIGIAVLPRWIKRVFTKKEG